MARPKPSMNPVRVAQYDRLIAAHPEIVRKGAANPYTSVNGHMFSGLNKEGDVGLRLSKEDRAAFEARFESPPFISYNTVMKEYVNVPQVVLDDEAEFMKYLNMSFAYVQSLKPNPSRKKG